jgi:hypothetical protein
MLVALMQTAKPYGVEECRDENLPEVLEKLIADGPRRLKTIMAQCRVPLRPHRPRKWTDSQVASLRTVFEDKNAPVDQRCGILWLLRESKQLDAILKVAASDSNPGMRADAFVCALCYAMENDAEKDYARVIELLEKESDPWIQTSVFFGFCCAFGGSSPDKAQFKTIKEWESRNLFWKSQLKKLADWQAKSTDAQVSGFAKYFQEKIAKGW